MPVERLIPDCCNTGVIFRTLLAVNIAVLLTWVVRTSGLTEGLQGFLAATILVEPVCLLSLIGLCALREKSRKQAPWLQRLLCAVVPAMIAGLLFTTLSPLSAFASGFGNLVLIEAMLIAALAGLLMQHYFELRVRAFSPALVEARLQALQARIRPHFLFNSLNAVLSLIRTEPRRAEETLEDLAEMFRVLMRDARDMTTIEKEIRFCRQYLSIEKIRLGPRLQVQWKFIEISEKALKNGRIPALLLQPLLENAVHYGVEPSSETSLVTIRFSRSIDRIEIVITNPYHGDMTAEAGNQMALNNIRERLALLYDVEGHLATRVVDGLFEVRLRFPYLKFSTKEVSA